MRELLRELKCSDISALEDFQAAGFFSTFQTTYTERLLFPGRLVIVLLEFILLHGLEHMKNGIWGPKPMWDHGRTYMIAGRDLSKNFTFKHSAKSLEFFRFAQGFGLFYTWFAISLNL